MQLYCFVLIDGRTYTLIQIAINILLLLLVYLGRNRPVVNVKQCSKRGLNDDKEYGLVFVSILVTLDIATCVSMHLLSGLLQSKPIILHI